MKTTIFFRADGHSQMGLGHVIRSLALADYLKNDFDCRFIIRNPSEAIRKLIEKTCSKVYELTEVLPFENEAEFLSEKLFTGNEILVLDGYHFDSDYQKIVKPHIGKMVCIDDIHATQFHADVIINHAPGFSEKDYSVAAETKFCLGYDYLLLRTPFLEAAGARREIIDDKNILICLGGADPKNDTISVLKKAVKEVPDGHFYVIIGAAYQYIDELSAYCKSNPKITILKNLTAEEMAETMKRCGTAFTSPSTVSLEYLAIGGNLFLKQIADNQTRIFNFLTENKIAFDFEKFGKTSSGSQNTARKNQKSIIDGNSRKRLQNIFRTLNSDLHANLRSATENDLEDYFNLTNDPTTRQNSFSSEPVSMNDHIKWFLKKLSDQNCRMYLLEFKGNFAGQIRFDFDKKATVSYSVAPEFRGRGFGKLLLKKGIEKFKNEVRSDIEIEGFVKKENTPSNRIFEKLGFQKTPSMTLPNAFRYSLV